jgi:hypothetical protein
MIGLVYADCDPEGRATPFHHQACQTFTDLASRHRDEIAAIADPYVKAPALRQLLQTVDFLFYWGHADILFGKAVLYGSRDTDQLAVEEAMRGARCKALYLDGCNLGNALNDLDLGKVVLVCPVLGTCYDVSIRTGCRVIADICGARRGVRDAFNRAAQASAPPNQYQVIGKGRSFRLKLREGTRVDLLHGFLELLLAWRAPRSCRRTR